MVFPEVRSCILLSAQQHHRMGVADVWALPFQPAVCLTFLLLLPYHWLPSLFLCISQAFTLSFSQSQHLGHLIVLASW